jgi:ribonuclease P protein component
MLSSPNRLRKGRDIARVYKRGTYGAGRDQLSVKVARGLTGQSRAVVIVSKKVDKRAVVRNTNRRKLAGALADIWATVPAGYDIVVSVHRDVSGAPAANLRDLLTEALRRAGLVLH